MAQIKLIVTGQMEKLALVEPLKKLFPATRIASNGQSESVIWAEPRKLNCATSNQLQPLAGINPGTPMINLAQAMLDEATKGKTGTPADLVIVIDDVELGNLQQEALVAEHFRAAVTMLLNNYPAIATAQRIRSILQEKCSFHLLKPMVESYLFGDSNTLVIAGVTNQPPPLRHPTDVEQFESTDSIWLPECWAQNASKQRHTPWWRHELHPKAYLEHLLQKQGLEYEETGNGKAALAALDWRKVPKIAGDVPILCALLEDLSDWFGCTNPLAATSNPDPSFYPAKTVRRNTLLLRNM